MRGIINRRRQKKIDYNKYIVHNVRLQYFKGRVLNLLDFMMYM